MDLSKFKKYGARQFVSYEQTGWLTKCEYAKPLYIFFTNSMVSKIQCYNKNGNIPFVQYHIELKNEVPTYGVIESSGYNMSIKECEEFIQMLHDNFYEEKFDSISYG